MENDQRYVISSLELHLFFSRIMKEHAIFLRAGFMPRDTSFAKQAEAFQQKFEQLLSQTLRLSDRAVSPQVLSSGEIVTEFTLGAERQTEWLTGISIDQALTARTFALRAGGSPQPTAALAPQVEQLNRVALRLLDDFIRFKEYLLENVLLCRMFTANYPLLIEHILREAKLYRDCLARFEAGTDFDCRDMRQAELFWNQIMMEHAQFIRGLLDPTEGDLIAASDGFAQNYATLLDRARTVSDKALSRDEVLVETRKFRDFKAAGAEGIQACKIRSIILPLLADHVLREANHYIRLLER